jgi:acyl-CoA synthetase (AMP-forming)/AMP-acid ligase II
MTASLEADCIGVVAANHVAYVERLFAIMSAGDVAVPLRSESDTERLRLLPIRRVETPRAPESGWSAASFSPVWSDAPALVSFTSGTEGTSKAVVISHRALADTVERLNRTMRVDASIREYVGVPVHHSFGFGRCRAVATAGGRFYVPARGFDPLEIVTMLRAGEINAISAVPTLWRTVLARPDILRDVGHLVRWVEIGSQFMSGEEKQQLRGLLPNAIIVQHYGLTEASRSSMLRIDAVSPRSIPSARPSTPAK